MAFIAAVSAGVGAPSPAPSPRLTAVAFIAAQQAARHHHQALDSLT